MTFALRDLPASWFDPNAVDHATAQRLLEEPARVAQKCTGRAKKPVFLFPHTIIKGPWLDADTPRLARELSRARLFAHWALPTTKRPVLQPSLFAHPTTHDIYLVTPPLHRPPTPDNPWTVEARCSNVSRFGPRTLEVIQRTSTGVIRVSDAARANPQQLAGLPEIWEHLLHRFLVQAGDSGLHNMLLDPTHNCAVGIDLDENRRPQPLDASLSWIDLLFKARPFKAARETMNLLRHDAHRPYLTHLFEHLHNHLHTHPTPTEHILHQHRQEHTLPELQQRLDIARNTLL